MLEVVPFDETTKVAQEGEAGDSDEEDEPSHEFASLTLDQKFVYLMKTLLESILEEENGKIETERMEQYLCERELRDLEAACGL
jgi:hypothetical protein